MVSIENAKTKQFGLIQQTNPKWRIFYFLTTCQSVPPTTSGYRPHVTPIHPTSKTQTKFPRWLQQSYLQLFCSQERPKNNLSRCPHNYCFSKNTDDRSAWIYLCHFIQKTGSLWLTVLPPCLCKCKCVTKNEIAVGLEISEQDVYKNRRLNVGCTMAR